jgi:hypothetical protein
LGVGTNGDCAGTIGHRTVASTIAVAADSDPASPKRGSIVADDYRLSADCPGVLAERAGARSGGG